MTIPKMHNLMVDVETLGTLPNRNPILQLSAVFFDLDNLTIGEGISYGFDYRTQTERVIDENTMQWWKNETSPEVRAELAKQMFDGVHTKDKLYQFNVWIRENMNSDQQLLFWAKPAAFDFSFVEGIYRDNQVMSPFVHWNVVDMGSYCTGRLNGDRQKYKELMASRNPHTAHNAAADCLWQLEWLFNVEKHLRGNQDV